MANPKYNVCAPITLPTGGTMWHTIGAAWETSKGGISVTLNSLPLGGKIMLFLADPAKAADNNTRRAPPIGLGPFDGDKSGSNSGPFHEDDDIPF